MDLDKYPTDERVLSDLEKLTMCETLLEQIDYYKQQINNNEQNIFTFEKIIKELQLKLQIIKNS